MKVSGGIQIRDTHEILQKHRSLVVGVNLWHMHQALDLTWGRVLVHNFTHVGVLSPHLSDDIVFLGKLGEGLDFHRAEVVALDVEHLPICLSFRTKFVEVRRSSPGSLRFAPWRPSMVQLVRGLLLESWVRGSNPSCGE